MPSATHEALVMLFRSQPGLAVQLLRDTFGVEVPGEARFSLVSETIRQARPVELFADLVVSVEVDGRPAVAIIVEVQLAEDERKRASWPVYVSVIHRDLGSPCLLLVITVDDVVARACARPIPLGPPGFVLTPFVVGPSVVPRVTSPDDALDEVELAVLSAVAHGRADSALEVAIQRSTRSRARVRSTMINGVSTMTWSSARSAWRRGPHWRS